jgi:hypothetical protein
MVNYRHKNKKTQQQQQQQQTSDWRTSLHVHERFPTDKQTLTDGP